MQQHPDPQSLEALPAHQRAIVEAAAVLEAFDPGALAALLDAPTGALEPLCAAGLLQASAGEYRLAPALQAAALEALGETPRRQRDLLARAVHHYAARLVAAPEPARAPIARIYMRHLERYCEALIQQEPTALAAEAGAAPLDALTEPADRYLLRYYRGLGEGLLDRFETARATLEDLLAEHDLDDTVRGRVLNAGAIFARRQGDYEWARTGYHESYQIWERLGNRARQGLALMNLGILNHILQDYPAAERDLLMSLSLFRETGAEHSLALAQMNLGVLARDQGRWDEALQHSHQAAELFASLGAHDFLGRVANNIGELEMLRGRFDAALAEFARAQAQMTTRVYAVDVHLNTGLVRQAQGDQAAALEHYRAALELALELGRHEIVALIYYRLGHAEQRLERLDAAQASYAAAITAIEANRAPVRDEGLLISLMGRWQQVYEAAVQLCLQRGDSTMAFDYAERARARAFADVLARRNSAGGLDHARLDPVTAHEAQAALPPGTLLLAYFATGLRGPESNLLDAIPGEAEELRACLATAPQLLLLALTRDELRVHRCPINPNALQASSPYLADGRRFLQRPVLRRAHAALIAPAAGMIEQAARVVIVPHGPLHQVPFAALLDAEDRPLLERATNLAYAPSATVLLRALGGPTPTAQSTCLALGYDGPAGRRLRHTEAEAATVAHICGGTAWRGGIPIPALPFDRHSFDRLRRGSRGNKAHGTPAGMVAWLREAGADVRWLHLACHGEFDLDDPLRSWLEIGPGEQLSAADVIASFTLRSELVTLSACRSGVSRVLRGDEPMGLVRAFLSAGARAVLVTLWPVEDSSARLLMERFYRALLDHGPDADPAAALQVAQRYLRGLTLAEVRDILEGWGEDISAIPLDAAARPYADPAFWGAYVLVGGPSIAPASTSINDPGSDSRFTPAKTASPHGSVSA